VRRLGAYWRFASLIGAYPLLAIVWAEALFVCGRNLGVRLHGAAMTVVDPPCGAPQCDFSVFWPAGVLARAGQVHAVYAPGMFEAWRAGVFGAGVMRLDWYYPPPALLAVMPVSVLPFEPGFWVWDGCLAAAVLALLLAARLPWVAAGAVLLCPAALWDWQLGQLGAVTGALLVCGLARESGVMLGLLAIKPQAGILAPVAMLAGRRWSEVLVAAGTVAGLLAMSTAWFGWGVWRDFFGAGLASSHTVLLDPDVSGSLKFGISVFWMARAAGAGVVMAAAWQAVAEFFAVAACWVVWRDGRIEVFERVAITAGLALLATPYGYTDDMVAFSAGLAALAGRRGWRIDLLDTLCWTWPTLSPVLFMRTGILATPAVVAVAVLRVWLVARRGAAVLPDG
jgi:hypothetical protein